MIKKICGCAVSYLALGFTNCCFTDAVVLLKSKLGGFNGNFPVVDGKALLKEALGYEGQFGDEDIFIDEDGNYCGLAYTTKSTGAERVHYGVFTHGSTKVPFFFAQEGWFSNTRIMNSPLEIKVMFEKHLLSQMSSYPLGDRKLHDVVIHRTGFLPQHYKFVKFALKPQKNGENAWYAVYEPYNGPETKAFIEEAVRNFNNAAATATSVTSVSSTAVSSSSVAITAVSQTSVVSQEIVVAPAANVKTVESIEASTLFDAVYDNARAGRGQYQNHQGEYVKFSFYRVNQGVEAGRSVLKAMIAINGGVVEANYDTFPSCGTKPGDVKVQLSGSEPILYKFSDFEEKRIDPNARFPARFAIFVADTTDISSSSLLVTRHHQYEPVSTPASPKTVPMTRNGAYHTVDGLELLDAAFDNIVPGSPFPAGYFANPSEELIKFSFSKTVYVLPDMFGQPRTLRVTVLIIGSDASEGLKHFTKSVKPGDVLVSDGIQPVLYKFSGFITEEPSSIGTRSMTFALFDRVSAPATVVLRRDDASADSDSDVYSIVPINFLRAVCKSHNLPVGSSDAVFRTIVDGKDSHAMFTVLEEVYFGPGDGDDDDSDTIVLDVTFKCLDEICPNVLHLAPLADIYVKIAGEDDRGAVKMTLHEKPREVEAGEFIARFIEVEVEEIPEAEIVTDLNATSQEPTAAGDDDDEDEEEEDDASDSSEESTSAVEPVQPPSSNQRTTGIWNTYSYFRGQVSSLFYTGPK